MFATLRPSPLPLSAPQTCAALLAILLTLIATPSANAAAQVAITSGPAAHTNASSATFAFDVTENGTATCQLDAGAFIACTSPVTYTAIADGGHTFRVRTGDFQAAHTWIVDTVPPETVFTTAPAISNRTRPPAFVMDSEQGARFECSLNGEPFKACAAAAEPAPVRDGKNSFAARAVDAAGNVDPTPAQYVWTADLTVPKPPIFRLSVSRGPAYPIAEPQPILLARTALLSWSAQEPGGLVSFSLERRREERWRQESRIVPEPCCVAPKWSHQIKLVQDDSNDGAVVKRIKPGKVQTTIDRGRSLCIAGLTTDKAGNRSGSRPMFSCVTRPFAIRSSQRFKLRATKVSADPTAWSGMSVRLKPSSKARVDMRTGRTYATPAAMITEATRIRSISLVGRACPSCGKVSVAIETLRRVCTGKPLPPYTEDCVFVKDQTLKRIVSFGGKRTLSKAIRSITLPIAAIYVANLRLRATGAPVELAGIAIPNAGGEWQAPEDA